jgi:peptidoglycan/LPS O-acetylase OafA/YrhL
MDISNLLSVLIWLIVIGVIFYVLWWLVGFLGLPEPFNKVARVIIAIVAVIFLINFLLPLAGQPPVFRITR